MVERTSMRYRVEIALSGLEVVEIQAWCASEEAFYCDDLPNLDVIFDFQWKMEVMKQVEAYENPGKSWSATRLP
jgi:hypothetical protein